MSRNQILAYGAAGLSLTDLIQGSPFQGYTYAYPHKTSYRRLPQPVSLDELWGQEDRDALFLYLHVPFCEMRCGFCNLFTQARPGDELPERFMAALERQAKRVSEALGRASFARVAFGGGTPTQLAPPLLERLLNLTEEFGAPLRELPVSLETSPETATRERLELLAKRGIDRISIGIQSFDPAELKALGRPQSTDEARSALDRIRAAGFPRLNIDLIYGVAGQSVQSWLASLRAALTWQPEELYLYPLYLRPLTGLGKLDRSWDDTRLDCYRAGRDLLLAEGYRQDSMRLFRLPTTDCTAPVYRCQEDGMVGLGCGARSYTRALHYSDEWAVSASSVKGIVADWVERDGNSFSHAWHGYPLNAEDQRRRYLLQSLLHHEGLDRGAYEHRFGADALDDFPQITELQTLDLAELTDDTLVLVPRGLELSDVIGPWLASDRARHLSREYTLQ